MKIHIRDAQRVAESVKARQVVVIAFDANGSFGVVSYGATKAECTAVKPMCDAIADQIAHGRLGLEPAIKGLPRRIGKDLFR